MSDTRTADDAAATARRLEVACRLVAALIARVEPEAAETTRPRREALDLIEELEWPIAVFDLGDAPQLVNGAWRALFGMTDVCGTLVGEARRTSVSVHVAELPLELANRFGYLAVTARPLRAPGAATKVVVACADITDDVIARELQVGAGALVWSGPLAGDPDYFNRTWSELVEAHPTWQHAIHQDDLAKCNEGLAWATRARGSTDIEARLQRADGDHRWHRIRFSLASSGARWFGTAIDFHDERDAMAARNELLARERVARADVERANRDKDRFLAAVSHELRAPLTTMMLWEGILRNDNGDAELREKALDAIRQSALVQSRVVGDLLDVARAAAGKLHVDLRPVEIEPVIRDAVDAIAPALTAKQIVLDRRGSLAGEVRGDAVRLRQVFVNLLENAVKFTDPGGRVTVAAFRRGRSITIEVEDSGRGIAPEFLSQLFEPFSQTESTTTGWESGLGLGLAIAKELVELHHGTITASSPGVGQGSKLTVVLPAAARRTATPPHGVSRANALARARVLVIDDDERVRDALAVLLDRAGAVVETAESAAIARTRIACCEPDAVVCDIAMPVEDGYEFIRGLRASRSDVAAIALTACATEADAARALAAGFDRHLAKPIDFERLAATIDEVIVARRASVGRLVPLRT